MTLITKAVFPVAGIGSRFLPVTKASPKEMLAIVDKPLIQYAVEEAVQAGLTHMIFITNARKSAIENHFDRDFELEYQLQDTQKEHLLNLVKNIAPPNVKFSYVRQYQPQGLGHAVLCAEHVIGQEPFALILADDLIDDSAPCLSAMIEHFQQNSESLLAVERVPKNSVHQYGVISTNNTELDIMPIQSIVEKPAPNDAPSDLAVIGRYAFTPHIFDCLKQASPDHGGEIQLTEGIQHLLKEHSMHAFHFKGKRYDCGSKLGFLQATVELGLKHAEVGEEFEEYLKQLFP